MGTTASYVYSITYPEESEKYLEIMIHLAPICFMKNVKSSVGVIGTTLLPFAVRFVFNKLDNDTFMVFLISATGRPNFGWSFFQTNTTYSGYVSSILPRVCVTDENVHHSNDVSSWF